ncbi:MAG TPA: hypothetical protein DDY98_08180 [Ruminococcaceae bacterium]|nr:hypothetical protein [Oscillospiraceae bacterium]
MKLMVLHWQDIVILCLLFAAVVFVVMRIIKQRKSRKNTSCGDCSACFNGCQCHKQSK